MAPTLRGMTIPVISH